jgi:hypothetical protein
MQRQAAVQPATSGTVIIECLNFDTVTPELPAMYESAQKPLRHDSRNGSWATQLPWSLVECSTEWLHIHFEARHRLMHSQQRHAVTAWARSTRRYTGGKLFAGLYALYAGLVFIVSAALIFTPIVHRVLHKFHWDSKL